MSKIARYYVASANPREESFPGVPLADITEEEWAEQPEWVQASVDASPMYRKTKPQGESKPTSPTVANKPEQPAPSEAAAPAKEEGK